MVTMHNPVAAGSRKAAGSAASKNPDVMRLRNLWGAQVACWCLWLASSPSGGVMHPVSILLLAPLQAALGVTAFMLVPSLPVPRTARNAAWALTLAALLLVPTVLDAPWALGLGIVERLAWNLGCILLLNQLASSGREHGVPWPAWLTGTVVVGLTAHALLNVDRALLGQALVLDGVLVLAQAVVLCPWLTRLARAMAR